MIVFLQAIVSVCLRMIQYRKPCDCYPYAITTTEAIIVASSAAAACQRQYLQ